MGGNSASRLPRLGREHILNAYKAGPEAVVSLIEFLQEQFQGSLDEMSNALAQLSEANKKISTIMIFFEPIPSWLFFVASRIWKARPEGMCEIAASPWRVRARSTALKLPVAS
jgi:hypothetical protein